MRIASTTSRVSSSSVDTNNTLEWTKIVSLFFLLFLFLSFLPIFDYHQFLLPLPDQAAMLCRLQNLSVEEDILGEIPDGHILVQKPNEITRIFLYATNLRKEIQCSSSEGGNRTFHYHNVYLNILHQDIEEEMDSIRESYSFPRKKWFYEREKYNHLLGLQNEKVDRHGLSEEPIDIYQSQYYWIILVMMKLLILLTDFILTICIYKILAFYQRRNTCIQNNNIPMTYYLDDVYDQ